MVGSLPRHLLLFLHVLSCLLPACRPGRWHVILFLLFCLPPVGLPGIKSSRIVAMPPPAHPSQSSPQHMAHTTLFSGSCRLPPPPSRHCPGSVGRLAGVAMPPSFCMSCPAPMSQVFHLPPYHYTHRPPVCLESLAGRSPCPSPPENGGRQFGIGHASPVYSSNLERSLPE